MSSNPDQIDEENQPAQHEDESKLEEAIVIYDFEGKNEKYLTVTKGEIISILKKKGKNWWTAKLKIGKVGTVPHNYVRLLKEMKQGYAVFNYTRETNLQLTLKRGEILNIWHQEGEWWFGQNFNNDCEYFQDLMFA